MLSHKISSKQLQTNKQNCDIKIYHSLQKVKEKNKVNGKYWRHHTKRSIKCNMYYSKNRNIYLGCEIKVVICNKFYKGNLPFFQIVL